jgi:hypothetical protein
LPIYCNTIPIIASTQLLFEIPWPPPYHNLKSVLGTAEYVINNYLLTGEDKFCKVLQ